MKTISTVNHQIGSYELKKISLSCYDDRRYVLKNGCDTLAYGNYSIQKNILIDLFFDSR